jgi:hypothetical protein
MYANARPPRTATAFGYGDEAIRKAWRHLGFTSRQLRWIEPSVTCLGEPRSALGLKAISVGFDFGSNYLQHALPVSEVAATPVVVLYHRVEAIDVVCAVVVESASR